MTFKFLLSLIESLKQYDWHIILSVVQFLRIFKNKDFLELDSDILIVLLLAGSADRAAVIHTAVAGGRQSAQNSASQPSSITLEQQTFFIILLTECYYPLLLLHLAPSNANVMRSIPIRSNINLCFIFMSMTVFYIHR